MATVLVVDDDAAVRNLVGFILKSNGHHVLSASNGLEGLMVYSSYHANVDVVLTDIDMPQMDGLELAARIRDGDPSKRILLMSGRPLGDRKAPANCPLIPKPFLPKQLTTAVEDILKTRV